MSYKIQFKNQNYWADEQSSLLDALLRQGVNLPFSCKKGVCHTCLLRATAGQVPAEAQRGIAPSLQQKGYFLPCICQPQSDLSLAEPDPQDFTCQAEVVNKQELAPGIMQILLQPEQDLQAQPGQFIHIHYQQQSRPYSIASLSFDPLELHVRRHDRGLFSRWLCDQVQVGDQLSITYPQGDNYYRAAADEPLILAGTGTGLAPLLGIVRQALILCNHQAPIYLYHGAGSAEALYADEELRRLEQQYDSFHYRPCLSQQQRIEAAIRQDHPSLQGAWLHLAGSPAVVRRLSTLGLELGAAFERIISDPYYSQRHDEQQEEVPYPPPAPELWQALDEGPRLKAILNDFYDAVYEDPILSPYFYNTTKERVKEKAYSFYRQLFSGEPVYFGDRPRNAHHWMVISDEIFDYREKLLQSFLFKHGLSAEMIQKWMEMEEIYRPDIVKDKPRGRKIGDIETPADGYDRLVLDFSTLCDGCQAEIDAGTEVSYHRRTGQVYCPQCQSSH